MTATARVALDASAFQAGAKAVERSMGEIGKMASQTANQMQSTLGKGLSSISGLGMKALSGLAGLAAGAVTVGATIGGVWGAMNEGGELVDLQEQTGVTIPKLMALRLAFEQAGLGAEDVQPTIAKLQRAIFDANTSAGPAAKAFEFLGLSAKDLAEMDADTQLLKVGDAIAGIENPTIKAAVAMEVFGKSGGRMLAFFATGGLDEAAAAVGEQADIMRRYAAAFDSITDSLGTYHTKLRGFFVGASAAIAPYLMQVSEWFKTLDFSKIGTQVGNAIATLYEVIAQGDLGTLVGDMLEVGFKTAGNTLFAYIVSELKTLQFLFSKIFEGAQPFLTAMGDIMRGMAMMFVSTIKKGIADVLYGLRGTKFFGDQFKAAGISLGAGAEKDAENASALMARGTSGFSNATKSAAANFGENLRAVTQEFATNFKAAMANPIFDTEEAMNNIMDRFYLAAEQVRKTAEETAPDKTEKKGKAPAIGDLSAFMDQKGTSRPGQVVGQFGSLGGGTVRGTFAALDPMVAQQKQTNLLLKKIEANTSGGGNAEQTIRPAYQA
jgi:hypothetical protein